MGSSSVDGRMAQRAVALLSTPIERKELFRYFSFLEKTRYSIPLYIRSNNFGFADIIGRNICFCFRE